MDQTTLIAKFKATIHQLADSRKAVNNAAHILAALFTFVLGLLAAAAAKRWGLPDALAAQIPYLATFMAVAIVGAGINYVHGQAKVDAEEMKSSQGLLLGSPELKAHVTDLVAEVIRDALSQPLLTTINGAPADDATPKSTG